MKDKVKLILSAAAVLLAVLIYKTKRKPTALWAVGDSLTGAGFKPSTCQDCEAIRFI